MPFVSGQFQTKGIESNVDDRINGVSFAAYLKNSDESPLTSAFGSVHELGTFLGGSVERKSLMLSVNVEAYWLDDNDRRVGRINEQAEVYFLTAT